MGGSSVSLQDVAMNNYRGQCTIETGGERGSGRSVLVARQDDDDISECVCLSLRMCSCVYVILLMMITYSPHLHGVSIISARH